MNLACFIVVPNYCSCNLYFICYVVILL